MPSIKAFLFYGPLLWLRKIIVYILGLVIILGFVLYFVANSPFIIKKVAETFAPDYNITYSRIYGNALTGIEIDDLAYNKEPLAQHIALRWNPNGLVKKKIIVSKLEIEKANVDTIKTLIASFPTDENQSKEVNSSAPFAFEVGVHHAALNLESFVEQGITFSRVTLDIKDVVYANESLNIGNLSLETDSNVTDIILHAGLKDGKVNVKELTIKELDALALQILFIPKDNESNDSIKSDDTHRTEKNTNNELSKNPLIPQWVMIDKLAISILPLKYDPVDIRSFNVNGSDAVFDVQNLLLQKANVDLNATTNLSNVFYTTKIKNNKLIGKVDFKPKERLFELYDLPIRHEAVGEITLDLNVSEEQVVTDLKITMKQLLKAEKDAFNLDIDKLHSYLVYDIKKGRMQVTSNLMITTPYAEDVFISNLFVMDDNISYSGEIHAEEIIGVEAKYVKPLNHLEVHYTGDIQSISTEITADNLKGTFVSDDFKNASLHLETKEALFLRDFVELPVELNQTKADLVIDAPLSFEENATLSANVNLHSNVVTMDANISYKENLEIKSMTYIPKESLLRPYSKELKWDSLNPIRTDAQLKDDMVDVQLQAGTLKTNAAYIFSSKEINGTLDLGGLKTILSGNFEEELKMDTKISSMPSLLKSVEGVYTLEALPNVKGSADLSVVISQLKSADVTLKSPHIAYVVDMDTEHVVEDITVEVELDASELVLKKYQLSYADQKLFSTKPSRVSFVDGNVSISPFWLNDELEINGLYDINASSGEVNATAKKLHIAHDLVELDSEVDVKTVLDGNKTSVHGKVIILGGNIYYDLGQKTYASDSDILIVQELKENEPSAFMENLSVDVQVQSKEPLVYKKGAIDIKAKADLGIHKAEQGELMLLGSVEILKGGSYTFERKRFVLDKSYVHFTGDPNNPLIEAIVNYKSLNHLITITVSGTPNTLHINFSSVPSLSRGQILSIILFDSEEGAGTNSGDDMMKMMGGAMAKSALSDLGVQLDHLVLGAGNSIEVGQKLSDKMTIIYVNDIVSGVKLKYEHTHKLESVISADEESQSYDIIYKRDF
ncbi:translocation/assembly module TamB domain-containing protein [Sulfurovum sp.]|uniref:translocation/assembly module TamB domain-containing protein n=1 Tax=Sulfurovum sp. TaxID=1969726 RepID=UPI002867D81D|nr:translocation/assembly module TamB domain-containing protein [Sulfurovum sp.]